MGSGAALQPVINFKKHNAEDERLLRAFFASGEYAAAVEDFPSQTFTALEPFGDECTDALLYDALVLAGDLEGFGTAASLDSSTTISFNAPAAVPTAAHTASSAMTVGCAVSLDVGLELPEPFGMLPPFWDEPDCWVPASAAEAHAVDMLALQQEFSMVPTSLPLPTAAIAAGGAAAASNPFSTVSAPTDLPTLAVVEAALAQLPTMAEAEGCLLTLCPTMWRDLAPPFRIKVNTGLRAVATPDEAPRTFYGAINPRVITTGCPGKRSGSRAHPYRRSPVTRSAAEVAGPQEAAGGSADRERDAATPRAVLEEVWLLKHNAAQPWAVAESFHCVGPFDGTTVPEGPQWPGACSVDLVARVGLGAASLWLKAEQRSVQSLAC